MSNRIPGRRTLAFLAAFGLAYAISDQAISAAVHGPGSWLTWQAITFICGLLTFVVSLALLGYRIAVPLRAKQQRRGLDYSRIASMEREIWGEAFEHAGAPAPLPRVVATRSTYACTGCGRDAHTTRRMCAGCYKQMHWNR